MWAVESNGVVSAVEERQRVGFYVPRPPGGHEPTLIALLTHALSANASTGGGARLVCMEPGGEFAVRRALDAVELQEADARAAHQASGFGALVAQSEESKQRQEWLNPIVPVAKRLFYCLRLSAEVHRFPDACVDQVRAALAALQLKSLDLVLVPWPADPSPLSRQVRQRQVPTHTHSYHPTPLPTKETGAGFRRSYTSDSVLLFPRHAASRKLKYR